MNRDQFIYKRYTCNKIGHLIKNRKLKDELCPKRNSTNCSVPAQRRYGNIPTVMATIVLLIGDAPH